ncbi:MAG: hypothetical protein ABSG68_01185 [Thermoguttaceae bacterium]|jgi:hypothetical protein
MSLLDKLERRFGRYAIPHLTEAIVAAQVVVYLAGFAQGNPHVRDAVALLPRRVLSGEVWRLLSFLADPPQSNLIFNFFYWYFFLLMGKALEAAWGLLRYDLYLLIGCAATVAVAFLVPDQAASNGFLQMSVFLAFALLYPDFQILLFFLLPVKVKWLALLAWIGYGCVLLFGGPLEQLLMGASLANYFVYFGRDIVRRMMLGRRRMAERAQRIVARPTARHTCRICGINNLTHPTASFRYCSQCAGTCCYCTDHVRNHEHLAASDG